MLNNVIILDGKMFDAELVQVGAHVILAAGEVHSDRDSAESAFAEQFMDYLAKHESREVADAFEALVAMGCNAEELSQTIKDASRDDYEDAPFIDSHHVRTAIDKSTLRAKDGNALAAIEREFNPCLISPAWAKIARYAKEAREADDGAKDGGIPMDGPVERELWRCVQELDAIEAKAAEEQRIKDEHTAALIAAQNKRAAELASPPTTE